MNDRLEQLLSEADRAVSAPAVSRDLAERVPGIVRGRRRRIEVAAFAMMVVVVVGVIVGIPRRSITRKPFNVMVSDVKSLQAEADRRMELAAKLSAENPIPIRQKRRSSALQVEVDRAAMGLVQQADRIGSDPALRDTAAEFYRQVQAELPHNCATDLARQRLAQLRDGKDI